jgi:uncharacterized protein YndB with AHSA1/START domain
MPFCGYVSGKGSSAGRIRRTYGFQVWLGNGLSVSGNGDMVERQVSVRAEPARVWVAVCDPGCFFSSGPRYFGVNRIDDALAVVRGRDGEMRVLRTVELRAPYFAAFRWEVPRDSSQTSTLVEFRIEDSGDGTCCVRVSERGFIVTGKDGRGVLRDHGEGWEAVLGSLRQFIEQDRGLL